MRSSACAESIVLQACRHLVYKVMTATTWAQLQHKRLACSQLGLFFAAFKLQQRKGRGKLARLTLMCAHAGSCAIFLSLGAVAFEGASIRRLDAHGLFGWMNLQYLGGVAWLATGPGVIGHTGMNCLLKCATCDVLRLACLLYAHAMRAISCLHVIC